MSNRIEVIICLGSSCFSRGNKQMLKAIQTYLKDNNLCDKVNFHGGHCFGNCADGPSIKVNGKLYSGINNQSAIDILNTYFDI